MSEFSTIEQPIDKTEVKSEQNFTPFTEEEMKGIVAALEDKNNGVNPLIIENDSNRPTDTGDLAETLALMDAIHNESKPQDFVESIGVSKPVDEKQAGGLKKIIQSISNFFKKIFSK